MLRNLIEYSMIIVDGRLIFPSSAISVKLLSFKLLSLTSFSLKKKSLNEQSFHNHNNSVLNRIKVNYS